MGPALCRLDELPEGSARGFDPTNAGRPTLFVVHVDGRVQGWRDACPHVDGAPMAWKRDAYLGADRHHIVCHAHGARFDPHTGQCVAGPALGLALTPVPLDLQREGLVCLADDDLLETTP